MPQTTAELIELLDLKQRDATTFIGRAPKTIMQRTYGGQVLSQALMAAYGTINNGRIAHSAHAYFLRPGAANEEITYYVEVTRDGGTFSSRRISAEQDGRFLFAMSTNFHDLEDSDLNHADPLPAVTKQPEAALPFADEMDRRFGASPLWREWDALETRYAGDTSAEGGLINPLHAAAMQVWVKTTGQLPDDPRLHQAVLAYLSDLTLLSVSTLPHPVQMISNQLQVSSIDHAIWFHRPCRADEWLLYDMVSPSASHALGFSTGRLFQGDQLIASCAQEGLVRKVDNRAPLT